MNLVSVYDNPDSPRVLYELLKERTPEMAISFKMPTESQHMQFVCSKPYEHWYLTVENEIPVGSIYLTKQREVGIFLFQRYHGFGFGKKAMLELMKLHPGKVYANVAPGNAKSMDFFERLGFKHIQNTYILEAYEQT